MTNWWRIESKFLFQASNPRLKEICNKTWEMYGNFFLFSLCSLCSDNFLPEPWSRCLQTIWTSRASRKNSFPVRIYFVFWTCFKLRFFMQEEALPVHFSPCHGITWHSSSTWSRHLWVDWFWRSFQALHVQCSICVDHQSLERRKPSSWPTGSRFVSQ